MDVAAIVAQQSQPSALPRKVPPNGKNNTLEAQLPTYWVPVLKTLLSVTQGPTIWVPVWLAGNEGKEKKMETAVMGYIGTTMRIHSFIPS